jgi:hypothetical protein
LGGAASIIRGISCRFDELDGDSSNEMAQEIPDEIFLAAFDEMIEQVSRRLASDGLGQETIWAAFRKATVFMARLALDVEDERGARRIAGKGGRTRRSASVGRRKPRTSSRLSSRQHRG